MTKKATFCSSRGCAAIGGGGGVGSDPAAGPDRAARVIVAAPAGRPAAPPPPIVAAPALPAASGPVQFNADFSSADLSAWQGRPWLPGTTRRTGA